MTEYIKNDGKVCIVELVFVDQKFEISKSTLIKSLLCHFYHVDYGMDFDAVVDFFSQKPELGVKSCYFTFGEPPISQKTYFFLSWMISTLSKPVY